MTKAYVHEPLKTIKDNIELNNAIEHTLHIVKNNPKTLCADDHLKLAKWLNELYMRRTGKMSKAMSDYRRLIT